MKKILAPIALAATLATGACSSLGKEPVQFKPGFNAVYAGLNTKQEEGYARVFTEGSVGNDSVRAYHHGLNEISGTDTSTYFGRNIFGVEPLNCGIEAVVDMRGGNSGLFDGQPFYGVREANLTQMLGADWGFTQATTNGEDSNFTLLYGKNMGFLSESLRPLSLELFHTAEHVRNGRDSNYTEIMVDWNISGPFSLFVRQDTSEFGFDDASYVIGGVWKL